MASNQKNSYPHFVPNQVLKSSTLNGYFEFLDRQTRLSRVHFLGCGIVNGLDFAFKEDALVIGPGIAVNGEGWFVQVQEETAYRYVARVKDSEAEFQSGYLEELASGGGSRVAWICFASEDDAEQLGLSPEKITTLRPDDYVVALAFGKRREYDSRCSHGSCDLNTADMVLETWPVLVPVGESLFQKITPVNMAVATRKEPGIEYYHGTVRSFNEQVLASARYWESELSAGMARLGKQFQSFSGAVWHNMFSDDNLDARFLEAAERIQGMTAAGDVPDYYIFFFKDIVSALNEFIAEYNAFAYRYEVIPNRIPADLLVYLGRSGDDLRKGNDVYRSVFRAPMDEGFRKDGKRLERMLRRICVLSECFIGAVSDDALSQKTFRLAKVRPGGRLSERPVPFYYDAATEGFNEVWNADEPFAGSPSDAGSEKASLDKYLSGSGSMSDEVYGFYPSAYQGKELSVVKGELEALNREMRLSLTLVEVRLNNLVKLTAKEVKLLRETFTPLTQGKSAEFIVKVQKECAGEAFRLAGILGTTYNNRLMDILQEGSPLTDGSYREICKMERIDQEDMSNLAKAFYKAQGKSVTTQAAEKNLKELSSALLSFAQAWRDCFVSTDKDVSMNEISKAVFMAPVKRGCRVYLFTKPVRRDKATEDSRIVVSYGVVYGSYADVPEEEPVKTYPLLFRMRTKVKESGEYASDIPDTVNPYGDNGKWNTAGDEIVLYPYQFDGTSTKKFETAGTNILCEISDPTILNQARIEMEDNVPSVVLKMVANGTSWVTLKVKDAQNTILLSRTFSVNVENPVWNRIPVDELQIFPPSFDLMKGEKNLVKVDVFPTDAYNPEMTWSTDNPSVATVDGEGLVTAVSEGIANVTVTSVAYPDKKCSVRVCGYSYHFRMKALDKAGSDTFEVISDKVNPYEDTIKWDHTGDQVVICPFLFDGADSKLAEKLVLACDVEDKTILQAGKDTLNKSTPAIVLRMLGQNGASQVHLRILKNQGAQSPVLYSWSFTMVVDNPAWSKVPVTKVTLTKKEQHLFVGQTDRMGVDVEPANAPNKRLHWESGSVSVATIDEEKGVLQALKEGSTKITVQSKVTPEVTDSATVTVSSFVFRASLNKAENGEKYADVPDLIRPNGDGGRWSSNLMIVPFEFNGKKKYGLGDDQFDISCRVSDPNVLSVTNGNLSLKNESNKVIRVPVFKLGGFNKGESSVTLTIRGPQAINEAEKKVVVLYEKTVVIKVE